MFIELTDHLRCPADHDESFLVLLPDTIEHRSVREGSLGCPVCGRTFAVTNGVLDAGGSFTTDAEITLDAEGMTTLVGLHGPGGYLVLVGAPAALWQEAGGLNPGVSIVALNPPAGVADAPGVSVVLAGSIPLKSSSMRGVVLGRGFASEAQWVAEAARVTLAGLRIIGEGSEPSQPNLEVLASAGGWWVARKTRNRIG